MMHRMIGAALVLCLAPAAFALEADEGKQLTKVKAKIKDGQLQVDKGILQGSDQLQLSSDKLDILEKRPGLGLNDVQNDKEVEVMVEIDGGQQIARAIIVDEMELVPGARSDTSAAQDQPKL